MILEKLKMRFPGIRQREPLKNHCTFRVGGHADFFYNLVNIEELPELVTLAEENFIPYKIIGRGTNILFTDKGFRGLIIKNSTKNFSIEGDKIATDSGTALTQIILAAIEYGLGGLEKLYGIPGSIGGVIAGNAGVPGAEICAFVKNVTLFNVADGVREVAASEIKFGYRESSLQDTRDIIMRAMLGNFEKASYEKLKKIIAELNKTRSAKQPRGFSAGSFFKNPSQDKKAGHLIEAVGLKGKSIGDAHISEKHANFFINRGNATFAQIWKLAKLAQQKVREKFSIDLEMEVKIIGDL